MGSIKYVITKSHLIGNLVGYIGRILYDKTVSFEELVDRVAGSNTTVSRPDVLAVIDCLCTTIVDMVTDGKSVVTPVAVYRPGLKGTFTTGTDAFDPSRHQLIARIIPGTRLRDGLRDARVVQVEREVPLPLPKTFIDVLSGAIDESLRAGQPAQLCGRRLQYDPAQPDEGIFFVDAAGTATRVEAYVVNTPSLVGFIVPPLAPGEYKLQVQARFNDTTELRTGQLPGSVTIS